MFREKFLTDRELDRFMAMARGKRHHALFAVLANLGIRPSEALALTRSDINLCDRGPSSIRVLRMKKRKTVAEFDDIEITPRLAAILSEHLATVPLEAAGRLFTLDRRTLQRVFKSYARRAGLPRRWRLYDLRHTAATRMYLATRDIKCVQAMLGHENPDTSTIYAHVPRSLLMATVNTMPVVV